MTAGAMDDLSRDRERALASVIRDAYLNHLAVCTNGPGAGACVWYEHLARAVLARFSFAR